TIIMYYLLIASPLSSSLLPYTTLFRSHSSAESSSAEPRRKLISVIARASKLGFTSWIRLPNRLSIMPLRWSRPHPAALRKDGPTALPEPSGTLALSEDRRDAVRLTAAAAIRE